THGAVELRLVRVRGCSSESPNTLRIGGWPVDTESTLISGIRPVAGLGLALDDFGTWSRTSPHPMGECLTIPWIGTAGAAADGDYAAVVSLGGEGARVELDGAGVGDDGKFHFTDG